MYVMSGEETERERKKQSIEVSNVKTIYAIYFVFCRFRSSFYALTDNLLCGRRLARKELHGDQKMNQIKLLFTLPEIKNQPF